MPPDEFAIRVWAGVEAEKEPEATSGSAEDDLAWLWEGEAR